MKESTLNYIANLRTGDEVNWRKIPSSIQIIKLYEYLPPDFFDFTEGGDEFVVASDREGFSYEHSSAIGYDEFNGILHDLRRYDFRPFKRCKEKTYYTVICEGHNSLAFHLAAGVFAVILHPLEVPVIKTYKELTIKRKITFE